MGVERIVQELISSELAPLGYTKQRGPRFGRSVATPRFDESFRLLDLGSPRRGVTTVVLYAAIFFPDLPPPRHFEVKEMKDMHWESRISAVAQVPEEWKFEEKGAARTAAKFRAAVQAASARFVEYAQNFRFLIAAGLGETGHADVLEMIRLGIDVNEGGALGTTPLIEAAARDYMPTVKALVEAGADPTLTRGGFTASHAALYMADYFRQGSEVGEYLLRLEQRAKKTAR